MAHGDDPQKHDLYQFEEDWPGWTRNQLTLAQCRMVIRSACEHYKVHHPRVRQHKRRSMSWCLPQSGIISLQASGPDNRGGKNTATALHEAAHHIAYHRHGERIEDHGPTFVGIFLDLLVRANVAPQPALEAQLRYRGVKWRKRNGRHSTKR
jgi:hypothetical protein